jgi:hypothetical protein
MCAGAFVFGQLLSLQDILFPMSIAQILSSIDAEISRLEQVRALLSGSSVGTRDAKAAPKRSGKRTISAAARKRIAEGQRKRWAALRRAAKG